jgi:hypothetical protein
MSFNLTFEITPELYRRAITTPFGKIPSKNRVMVQNLAAAVLFPFSIFAFNRAFFAPDSLIAMLFAAILGAGLVFAVWWRQHRKLVGVYSQYNDTGGTQSMHIGAAGISAQRPHIKSIIDWPFVNQVRSISGATLIELPAARLIVPDTALPEGVEPARFAAQLEEWRTA